MLTIHALNNFDSYKLWDGRNDGYYWNTWWAFSEWIPSTSFFTTHRIYPTGKGPNHG